MRVIRGPAIIVVPIALLSWILWSNGVVHQWSDPHGWNACRTMQQKDASSLNVAYVLGEASQSKNLELKVLLGPAFRSFSNDTHAWGEGLNRSCQRYRGGL
jgi:hypothetical protein